MLRSLSRGTKKCDTYVYTSFFLPLIRRNRDLTQHVRETTSEVGETTVNPYGEHKDQTIVSGGKLLDRHPKK